MQSISERWRARFRPHPSPAWWTALPCGGQAAGLSHARSILARYYEYERRSHCLIRETERYLRVSVTTRSAHIATVGQRGSALCSPILGRLTPAE